MPWAIYFVCCHREKVITVITRTQSSGNENKVVTVTTSALEPALNRDDDQKLSTGQLVNIRMQRRTIRNRRLAVTRCYHDETRYPLLPRVTPRKPAG